MNRDHIEKIAKASEDRILLAKLWDKIQMGMQRNIPSHTSFLTQRELEMAQYLFGKPDGLVSFGGFEGAERKILCYLPDYLDADWMYLDSSPVACLRASFYQGASPSHRDFLGGLMGCGISRDSVGDICISQGSCDFFVTAEIAPYLLQSFTGAGKVKLQLSQIPLKSAQIPEPEVKELCDTLASLRLDAVISSGFRISRAQAAQYICSGKAALDGLPCEKPDKTVALGSNVSIRGMGKIKLHGINGQTRKGRISVVIHRYV